MRVRACVCLCACACARVCVGKLSDISNVSVHSIRTFCKFNIA